MPLNLRCVGRVAGTSVYAHEFTFSIPSIYRCSVEGFDPATGWAITGTLLELSSYFWIRYATTVRLELIESYLLLTAKLLKYC